VSPKKIRSNKPTLRSGPPWPPLVRVKVARTEIIPIGNTKFWDLAKKGLIELAYVDGVPFAVTASLLKLIDESPRTKVAALRRERQAATTSVVA
jgi:hypothetical protein